MTETIKSTKKFGSRYGRRLKERFGIVEDEQRKKHICPYCRAKKVKRLATGIWHCGRCYSKFTGKAYSIERKLFPKEEELPPEETKEKEQEEEGKKW